MPLQVPTLSAAALGAQFSREQCEVESSGPLCLGANSEELVLPPALAPGLRGFWSFDRRSVLDATHWGHHGVGTVQPGPALGGGSSAYFRGTFLEVKDSG